MRALTVCGKEKRTLTLGMTGGTPERSTLIERVFQRLHLVAFFCLTAMQEQQRNGTRRQEDE